jgi:mannose-6-phosphate isomerase
LAAWGKRLPPGFAIGESWELFDDAQGAVRVAQGPARGQGLRALIKAWGPRLLGPGAKARAPFPLMLKLLDARHDLSVQVHPNDALAKRLHGKSAAGKSEMWVVLDAAPGAAVYAGFKPGTDRKAYTQALASGSLLKALRRWPVKAGDVLSIPAGRIHAVGRGCLLAEIQQNSDHTYRIWDWGRGRELHLDKARAALRFGPADKVPVRLKPQAQAQAWGRLEHLLDQPGFRVERWTLRKGLALPARRRPWALLVAQGKLRLAWGGATGMMVPTGSTVLLPAALAAKLEPSPRATLIAARPV